MANIECSDKNIVYALITKHTTLHATCNICNMQHTTLRTTQLFCAGATLNDKIQHSTNQVRSMPIENTRSLSSKPIGQNIDH